MWTWNCEKKVKTEFVGLYHNSDLFLQFSAYISQFWVFSAILSFFTELQDRISELWDISTELQKIIRIVINSQLQGKSENLEKKVRIARCKRWDVNVELQEKCLNCENSILRKKYIFEYSEYCNSDFFLQFCTYISQLWALQLWAFSQNCKI